MTDREPDDLYDALRDRLADYGQEPPAPLWANIRAQLPPPVVVPQRRRRTRRLALAALVLLLLVGLGTWQWWQPGGQRSGPASHLLTQTSTHSALPPQRPINSPATELPEAANHLKTATQQAANEALAPATEVDAAGTIASASTSAASQPAARKAEKVTTVARSLPQSLSTVVAAYTSRSRRPAASVQALTSARTTDAATRTTTQAPHQSGADTVAATALTVAATQPSTTAEASSQALGEQNIARTEKIAANEESRNAPTASARTASGLATARAARERQPAPTVTAANNEAPQLAMKPTLAAREAWQPAELRAASLLLQPAALPVRLAAADTLPPLPVSAVRRWAVQALAGPALTSRTLNTGRLSYASPSSSNLPPTSNYIRNVLSTTSANNEQAAAGFGAEVQLQRQLNGRWSLGSGLGFQTFATKQLVNVRVVYANASPASTSFKPDSLGTITVRDTYHFLTLPLHIGYQLGTGRARLRYGLRAGADVALYLGGRSTEGSSVGSTSRSWGISGSPYRSLSLALSLGAEVRYRLAPGWELLAQPTLTHFATSLARPSSGYVARYPLAATALVGVAWWLH